MTDHPDIVERLRAADQVSTPRGHLMLEAAAEITRLRAEAEALRKALAELVELKDIKDRLAVGLNEVSYFQGGKYLLAEYERRKPLAWAAARTAIAATKEQQARGCGTCALNFVDSHRCDVCHGENNYKNWTPATKEQQA